MWLKIGGILNIIVGIINVVLWFVKHRMVESWLHGVYIILLGVVLLILDSALSTTEKLIKNKYGKIVIHIIFAVLVFIFTIVGAVVIAKDCLNALENAGMHEIPIIMSWYVLVFTMFVLIVLLIVCVVLTVWWWCDVRI